MMVRFFVCVCWVEVGLDRRCAVMMIIIDVV